MIDVHDLILANEILSTEEIQKRQRKRAATQTVENAEPKNKKTRQMRVETILDPQSPDFTLVKYGATGKLYELEISPTQNKILLKNIKKKTEVEVQNAKELQGFVSGLGDEIATQSTWLPCFPKDKYDRDLLLCFIKAKNIANACAYPEFRFEHYANHDTSVTALVGGMLRLALPDVAFDNVPRDEIAAIAKLRHIALVQHMAIRGDVTEREKNWVMALSPFIDYAKQFMAENVTLWVAELGRLIFDRGLTPRLDVASPTNKGFDKAAIEEVATQRWYYTRRGNNAYDGAAAINMLDALGVDLKAPDLLDYLVSTLDKEGYTTSYFEFLNNWAINLKRQVLLYGHVKDERPEQTQSNTQYLQKQLSDRMQALIHDAYVQSGLNKAVCTCPAPASSCATSYEISAVEESRKLASSMRPSMTPYDKRVSGAYGTFRSNDNYIICVRALDDRDEEIYTGYFPLNVNLPRSEISEPQVGHWRHRSKSVYDFTMQSITLGRIESSEDDGLWGKDVLQLIATWVNVHNHQILSFASKLKAINKAQQKAFDDYVIAMANN